jgi:hypothetical protein
MRMRCTCCTSASTPAFSTPGFATAAICGRRARRAGTAGSGRGRRVRVLAAQRCWPGPVPLPLLRPAAAQTAAARECGGCARRRAARRRAAPLPAAAAAPAAPARPRDAKGAARAHPRAPGAPGARPAAPPPLGGRPHLDRSGCGRSACPEADTAVGTAAGH